MIEKILYIAYVVGDAPDKEVKYSRVRQPKTPYTSVELINIAKAIIGDSRPFVPLLVEDPSELEDKLNESGFNSKIEFISNYSAVIP
jgi:hypothetical protein